MIRNHPDALAILAILLFSGVVGGVAPRPRPTIEWTIPGLRQQIDTERQHIDENRDRLRDELRRALRFRDF